MIYKRSWPIMIELEKLNGETFLLNALMIEQVQSHPDTTITLHNGKKLVVKTSEEEVYKKIISYYQQIGLVGQFIKNKNENGTGGVDE